MPEELAGGSEVTTEAPQVTEPQTEPQGSEYESAETTPTEGAAPAQPGVVESYTAPQWFNQILLEDSGTGAQTPQTPQAPPQAPPVAQGDEPAVQYPTADDWLDDPARAQDQYKRAMQAEQRQYQSRMDQRLGELEKSNKELTQKIQEQREAEITREVYATRSKFDNIYKALNQSKNFMANEKLRNEVDTMIGRWLQMGLEKARAEGDTSYLREMRKPEFPGRILRVVEGELGISGEPLPIMFAGAHQASGKPSPKDSSQSFSREELDAMREAGLSKEQVAAARKKMGRR